MAHGPVHASRDEAEQVLGGAAPRARVDGERRTFHPTMMPSENETANTPSAHVPDGHVDGRRSVTWRMRGGPAAVPRSARERERRRSSWSSPARGCSRRPARHARGPSAVRAIRAARSAGAGSSQPESRTRECRCSSSMRRSVAIAALWTRVASTVPHVDVVADSPPSHSTALPRRAWTIRTPTLRGGRTTAKEEHERHDETSEVAVQAQHLTRERRATRTLRGATRASRD